MHPAASVIVFTTLSGAGYGLLALSGVMAPMGWLPADRFLEKPVDPDTFIAEVAASSRAATSRRCVSHISASRSLTACAIPGYGPGAYPVLSPGA